MKVVVKRWGNSFGIHIPKEIPGLGRLHENMVLDIDPKIVKDVSDWKPHLIRGLDPDLSTRIDEILEEELDARWGKRAVRPSS